MKFFNLNIEWWYFGKAQWQVMPLPIQRDEHFPTHGNRAARMYMDAETDEERQYAERRLRADAYLVEVHRKTQKLITILDIPIALVEPRELAPKHRHAIDAIMNGTDTPSAQGSGSSQGPTSSLAQPGEPRVPSDRASDNISPPASAPEQELQGVIELPTEQLSSQRSPKASDDACRDKTQDAQTGHADPPQSPNPWLHSDITDEPLDMSLEDYVLPDPDYPHADDDDRDDWPVGSFGARELDAIQDDIDNALWSWNKSPGGAQRLTGLRRSKDIRRNVNKLSPR